jgi:hypothetical protein
MIPLLAQSISLDSPFNIYSLFKKEKDNIRRRGGSIVALLSSTWQILSVLRWVATWDETVLFAGL